MPRDKSVYDATGFHLTCYACQSPKSSVDFVRRQISLTEFPEPLEQDSHKWYQQDSYNDLNGSGIIWDVQHLYQVGECPYNLGLLATQLTSAPVSSTT